MSREKEKNMPLTKESVIEWAERFMKTHKGACTMDEAHDVIGQLLRVVKEGSEPDVKPINALMKSKGRLSAIQQDAEDAMEEIDVYLKESGNTTRISKTRRCGG